MTWLSQLGLADLVTLVLTGLTLVGGLVGRRGLIGSVLSAAGTLVLCWLVAAGLHTWGSGALRDVADHSALLRVVPVPEAAAHQARHLGQALLDWFNQVSRS